MTAEVEKIITRPIVSLEVKRIILVKDQSGINDKIHNSEKDYNEIELSTSDTVQNDTNNEIHDHEIDHDEIELSTSDKVQNDNNDEIHDHEIDLDEIELSIPEQWERFNELLLLITTILMFNVTSLLIAVFQISSTNDGSVFNKALILQSQKTIGMSIL